MSCCAVHNVFGDSIKEVIRGKWPQTLQKPEKYQEVQAASAMYYQFVMFRKRNHVYDVYDLVMDGCISDYGNWFKKKIKTGLAVKCM